MVEPVLYRVRIVPQRRFCPPLYAENLKLLAGPAISKIDYVVSNPSGFSLPEVSRIRVGLATPLVACVCEASQISIPQARSGGQDPRLAFWIDRCSGRPLMSVYPSIA
jgi:hypothetical protein